MVELSDRTIQLIEKLFHGGNLLEADRLLRNDCADNLPLCEKPTPNELERIRFAAIKLSQGDLFKLYYAVDLAQKDWRDLLMASDFASDIKAHDNWATSILG